MAARHKATGGLTIDDEVFETNMQTAFFHLTTIATLAVLVVLIAGLITMMRGKSGNLSQKLMRWRVGLQFVALVIIMGFVFLSRS